MREGHAMAVVTISRHFGAGGHTLGQMLCERFDFRLADASVVDRLARNAKLSPDWLNAMEQEASSTILSMISTLVSGGIFYKHPGSPAEKDDRQKYIAFLTQIFTAMANEGGYVIVGRGAQFILKGHPKAIHVLLVADYESRVSFLMDQHKITRSDAEKTIRAREKERTALASRLFETDIDDASLYQIVLNTGTMPYDWVVDTVSELVTKFMERE
jgi:cytidylate kinase